VKQTHDAEKYRPTSFLEESASFVSTDAFVLVRSDFDSILLQSIKAAMSIIFYW